MKVLGIDPGLRKTGWGIINFNNNIMYHIDNGFISPLIDNNDGERLLSIFKELNAIITYHKPSLIGIERSFVGQGNISSLKLGMARGICILAAANAKIKIRELAPKLIKKSITGSGLASKYQVNEMVKKLLGVTPKNEDSSDALAIAISVNNFSKMDKVFSKDSNENNLNKAIKSALLKEDNNRKN